MPSQETSFSLHEGGVSAHGLATAARRSDVPPEYWDDLFNAVTQRLGQLVRSPHGLHGETVTLPGNVQSDVLECVAALDQLHGTLGNQLARCERLEHEIFVLNAALAQAQAGLLRSAAGERRARHLVFHDSLTALPNWRFFREHMNFLLTDPVAVRQGFAVIYLDLDGFRPVNETHGREAGDALLKTVAGRLSHTLGPEDVVSRLGGDEFACLLNVLPEREELSRHVCRIFDAVTEPVSLGALQLQVRPSIGIATAPADGGTADTLLKHADLAMHWAKRRRTGYSYFDQCQVA